MKDIVNNVKNSITKEFSGVVTLDIGSDSIIAESSGLRDINNGLKNNINTKFGIASGTKFFTALGIGILIDRGLLTLDSRVWDIIGGSPSYISSEATIKDLLTHTSGIYDYLDEEEMDDDEDFDLGVPLYKLINPTDYLPLFEGNRPKFKPGERCSYSNGGYVLLGAVIEKVSGILFRDFIMKNVIIPSDMKETGFFFLNDLPSNSAIGYKSEGDKLVANYYSIPIVGGADGGIFSTAGDIKKLWTSFAEYRILSKELTELFITPYSKVGEADYGLGLYISDDDLFLYGCDPGVGFHSRFNIKSFRVISILSNRTYGLEGLDEVFWNSDI